MTRGIKIRLIAFAVLSAVGIVYVTASYLGLVDKVLGRGLTVHATLPESGGVYEGSEVTYRGVKVGRVEVVDPTRDGVKLDLALEEGTKIPEDSLIRVHNLSAVGEQYLDFEPPDADPPYARDGYTFHGDQASLPVDEGDLLIDLDQFVNSVDKKALQTVIHELGVMFNDTGTPLQRLIDSGTEFVSQASAHTDETIALLNYGRSVLATQQANGENIRSFARDLGLLTRTLAASDQDLRTVLEESPGAIREIQGLLDDIGPTLPALLGNLVTVDQVVVTHIDGLETILVEFPLAIAAGFTGTPGGKDHFGHVNLQFTQDPPPCSGEGYKPLSQWRSGQDLTDGPIYPAECLKGVPYNQRGSKYSPDARPSGAARSPFAAYGGEPGAVHAPSNLSVLGSDSWKWLLVGPVAD